MPDRQPKGWKVWVVRNRFTILLCALALLVFAGPITNAVRDKSPALFSRLLVSACFSLMLLSALVAISRSRRRLIVAAFLSAPAVLFQSVSTLDVNDHVRVVGYVLTIIFLGYVVAMIIGALFRRRAITTDMICASLCAYLLLGVCWAFVYSLTELLLPGSFSISESHLDVSGELNVSGAQSAFAIYYSFITLSTLGYGDVIPVNPVSRALSYSEAVTGQIYMAVLVARLVGLQISQALAGNGEGGRETTDS